MSDPIQRSGSRKKLRAMLVGLSLFSAASALAQPQFVTILTNGPVLNRLNVVVLSEAYTTNQLGQFFVDATNTMNALLAELPYQEYRNYFNGFAIGVASVNSGSSHYGAPNDTYFNSSYDLDSDLLITIPPNDADTNYDHGQGKVDALLQSYLPNCHLRILLVKDPTFGGSDNSGNTAIAATSTGSSIFVIHETGHVLANLGDEYTYAYPGAPEAEEPNTTTQTNANLIKWSAWIDTNSTPIPTPPTAPYVNAVGLFEGAHYHSTGWFRPQINCAMGNFSSPFCAVCSEALVLSIYQRVRPVDEFSPALTNLSVSSTQSLTFSVTVLQPSTHNLSIQWLTNSVPVPGATNLEFNISASLVGSGVHHISVQVHDGTPLVRNDPDGGLTQTITWTVSVDAAELILDSPTLLSDRSFFFRVTGNAPQSFVIESSTDLFIWNSLVTNSLVNGTCLFTNAPGLENQFFRAHTPP